jgi:VIT1/CCC1 family predicted Fe2+/Mn2+ transporter
VAGAGLSSEVIIVLGLANLAGDGFSMAASNYLGTRADRQLVDRARRIEESHIAAYPAGEREEIRQIFQAKGLSGTELESIVSAITSDRKRWINTMILDEYGLSTEGSSPFRAAAVTFCAFVLLGALPLVSFLWQFFAPSDAFDPYFVSSVVAAFAFFLVGAIKGRFVSQRWYWSAIETTIVGSAAAGLAYLVGVLFRGVLA